MNKYQTLITLIVISLLTAACGQQQEDTSSKQAPPEPKNLSQIESARQLIDAGKTEQAITTLQALLPGPDKAEAHFQLATIYSSKHQQSLADPCADEEDYTALAFEHLTLAIGASADYAKRAASDAGLQALANSYSFSRLTSQAPFDEEAMLKAVIRNGEWSVGNCEGLYPKCTTFSVNEAGKFSGQRTKPCMEEDCVDLFTTKTLSGTARIVENNLVLELQGGAAKEYPLPRRYADPDSPLVEIRKNNCDA